MKTPPPWLVGGISGAVASLMGFVAGVDAGARYDAWKLGQADNATLVVGPGTFTVKGNQCHVEEITRTP